MAAEGGDSRIAILAALGANAGIMVAKFIGAFITGSSSMLAEAVHSVADTGNEALLLVGRKGAEQRPDTLHPFGYSRNRYFYSFVVALVLFTMGCLFAVNEAIHKIRFPEEISSPAVAFVILGVSMVLEAASFRTARKQSAPLKGKHSWWHFIRNTRNPELPVVLLEDAGALTGLVFALGGVSLTVLTGNAVWDGIGTLLIGLLLGVNAIVLIIETKSLLIGEGATAKESTAIHAALLADPRVLRVIRVQTQYLGPEDLLVNAKIAVRPGLDIAEVGEAIDAADSRIRAAAPNACTVYLEPAVFQDLDS
ncbi:cation diffusion facilitator family transporter [Nocardia mangyaensis]|uniref:cation diffusion facilitator family transporter n=1 Tax=Nocardia mangyaensis TaxID=2213200 RepID=UPI002675DFFB|nr:cation diffusion facilitator family transporter [Nocardia mangyaensis]MDO3645450.1 cation diffusion facilitator family transporter [Nocardia mangyaensis]